MRTRFQKAGALVLLAALALWAGCSESTAPATDSGVLSATELAAASLENEMDFLNEAGIPATPGKGMFSIDWHRVLLPGSGQETTVGQVFAVAFADEVNPGTHFRPAGIDMGTVTIRYLQEQVELPRRTPPRGGVIYALLDRPRPGPGRPGGQGQNPPPLVNRGLPFHAGTDYTFDISGTDNFSPLSFTVTAPSGMLEITAPQGGQVVNPSEDLVLNWTGGNAGEKILLHIAPLPRMQPGQRPNPGRQPRGIVKLLENNLGTFTVSASRLQEFLNQSGAEGIMCSVSQMQVQKIAHDGDTLHAAVRNGDRIRLSVE